MIKILHISPHFGGGVGTVLMSLIPQLNRVDGYSNEVVSLEYANKKAKNWSIQENILISDNVSPTDQSLHERMQGADIVHIHYWNHPLLYLLFHTFSGKIARTVIWSHVNGYHAPYLFNDELLNYAEIFVTATDYSLAQKNIARMNKERREKHIYSIHSCSGLNDFDKIEPRLHEGFNIGYVGTVDYCKMHHNFINLCAGISVPKAKFIVVGGDAHDEMLNEAIEKGIAKSFNFTGKVDDVKPYLETFDIFAYPLSRENYGTGEQVLIEAMSAGIPQVVFAGGAEEYVVQDGVTGLVVNNDEEYVQAIETLYSDSNLRKKMSIASRAHAKENFTLKKSVEKWLSLYAELLARPKRECNILSNIKNDSLVTLFLLALGDSSFAEFYKVALSYYPKQIPDELKQKFLQFPPILRSATRGSIHHYSSFIDDKEIKYLATELGG